MKASRHRRFGLLAAGLVVVALAGVGIWLWVRDTAEAPAYRFLAAVEHHTGFGGTGRTQTLAFSPDGAWLASAETDGVSLWDTRTQELVDELPYTGSQVSDQVHATVAFSPDGALLAGATPEGVWLWNTTSWEHLRTLPLRSAGIHVPSISSVAFSPDGEMIAVGGSELAEEFVGLDRQEAAEAVDEHAASRVWIWNPGTGEMTADLDFGENGFPGVEAVAFTPNGNSLASIVGSTVRLSEPRTAREQAVFDVSEAGRSMSVAPDGDLLAVATGRIQLWDLENSQQVDVLEPDQGAASLVAFSPDGSHLATVSRSFYVVDPLIPGAPGSLWSPEGRELGELDPPDGPPGICAAGTQPQLDGLAISADGLLVVQNRCGLYWWGITSG